MINYSIERAARLEFSRALRFASGAPPRLPAPAAGTGPRLLYLHIPFCEQLCPYCSFNRFPFEEKLARAYFKALREEIRLYKTLGYDFSGIYIGGGTPTVLADELEETIAAARASFAIRAVSVETNPNHLTEERLAALTRAGVHRLSVGVQSFDDGLLKRMGRYDKYGSGAEIAARLTALRGRFATLNADMIFNFPTQTPAMLERDLDMLLAIGIDQTTWYPLMVSDATRRQVIETLGKVDPGQEERLYRRICDRLIPAYRFSSAWCFSQGEAMIDEYVVDYEEYAGLGSGSIGYLEGLCYANTFSVDDYIGRIGRGELPLAAARVFSLRDRIRYSLLMGLFGTELDLQALERKYGPELWRIWPDIWLFRLIGAVRREGAQLVLTGRGRYLWVALMRGFFTAVNNFRDDCRARLTA